MEIPDTCPTCGSSIHHTVHGWVAVQPGRAWGPSADDQHCPGCGSRYDRKAKYQPMQRPPAG